MIDPLHIPAACRGDDTDYQWFSMLGIRDPSATGWVEVTRSEMPDFPSDCATTIDRREMRLYKRPLALTESVRRQEQAVAQSMLDDADQIVARLRRGEATPPLQPRRAQVITTPLGPNQTGRSLRGLLVFAGVWLRRYWGAPDSPWLVRKFMRFNEVGLRRWADDNRMTERQYVEALTGAILDGRGGWPGVVVRGMPRE